MFSARLGFMRPDSVTEPDGPVLPEPIPNVFGNALFTTNIGKLRRWNNTYMEIHPFNDLVGSNWNLSTTVLAPPGAPEGYADWNGTDTSQYKNVYQSGIKPGEPHNLVSGQGDFNQFSLGCFIDGGGNTAGSLTNGGQIGVPMKIRSIIIHNGVYTPTETEKIQGWMAHDAGLSNILQGDHPYKSAPPTGFTPIDLDPLAWWHAESGFSGTGNSATWTSMDGNHTLTRGSNITANTIQDNFQSEDYEGITVIEFPNSRTSKGQGFTGCKYVCASLVNGNNFNTQGISIIMLWQPRDIPGIWDYDTWTAGGSSTGRRNASAICLQSGGDYYALTYDPRAMAEGDGINTFGVEIDTETGNVEVDPANVSTDGGNVSV